MKQLSEEIRSGSLKNLYLLTGPEAYLRARAFAQLCDAAVSPDDGMNRTVFEGKDVREGEIIDQAETMPFFSERRLVVVRDTGIIKGGSDSLAEYCASLPDYLILVFNEEEADKKCKLYKAIKTHGRVVEFPVQDEAFLKRWLASALKKADKVMTTRTAELFLERTGSDLGRIDKELDKLISYAGDREEITARDVQKLTTPQIENRIFDMISAVSDHDRKKALALYADLLTLKEAPMRILVLIERQYRQMLLVKAMRRDGTLDDEIASSVGIPAWVVRKMASLTRSTPVSRLSQMAEMCVRMEEDVKNGRISDRLSVELLLIALAR